MDWVSLISALVLAGVFGGSRLLHWLWTGRKAPLDRLLSRLGVRDHVVWGTVRVRRRYYLRMHAAGICGSAMRAGRIPPLGPALSLSPPLALACSYSARRDRLSGAAWVILEFSREPRHGCPSGRLSRCNFKLLQAGRRISCVNSGPVTLIPEPAAFHRSQPTMEFNREAHLSAECARAQAPPWLPRAHGHRRRPQRRWPAVVPRAASASPREPRLMVDRRPAEAPAGFPAVSADGRRSGSLPGCILSGPRNGGPSRRTGLVTARRASASPPAPRSATPSCATGPRRRMRAAAAQCAAPSRRGRRTDYVLIARAGTLKRPLPDLVADLEAGAAVWRLLPSRMRDARLRTQDRRTAMRPDRACCHRPDPGLPVLHFAAAAAASAATGRAVRNMPARRSSGTASARRLAGTAADPALPSLGRSGYDPVPRVRARGTIDQSALNRVRSARSARRGRRQERYRWNNEPHPRHRTIRLHHHRLDLSQPYTLPAAASAAASRLPRRARPALPAGTPGRAGSPSRRYRGDSRRTRGSQDGARAIAARAYRRAEAHGIDRAQGRPDR